MDLIGLGSNFETISYIPYTNLQWNRRYYECGKWSAQIEESEYDPRIKYVYTPERPELGLVERMESSDTIKGKFVQISGYFIEHIFDRQIAFPPIEGSFRLPDLVYQFVSRSWYKPDLYTIEPASNLPTDTVDVKWENEKIGKLMYETLKTLEYSPRLIYNPTTNKFIFSIWQGKDRTQSQSANAFVTFADDSCNVEKFEYIEDESNFKNVVMILYGEQPSRYDVYGDLTTEKGRRWLLLTGGSEEELAEYKQKAKEELSKYPIVQTANVEVIQDGLYYMIDYDLGDKCDIVSHRHQKAFEARLIEVDEVWKAGQHNVKLKFGETSKTVYQKLQRSIATERYAHSGTGGVAGSGIPGADGKDGVGIASVQQTTTSTADGGENIITLTLTDGSSNRFSVRNGSKGSTGDTGPAGAAGKDGSPGKDGADGKDGSDGYTPVCGVDYWTAADKEEIISEVVEEIGAETGGAGKPNNYAYDGKDLSTVFASAAELHAAVAAGDFGKIRVGDYWPITLSGSYTDYGANTTKTLSNAVVKLEVAGIDTYINYGDTALTSHHLVMCSRDLLPNATKWRTANTTWTDPSATNPWKGSAIYKTLNTGILPLVTKTDIGAFVYAGPNGNGMRFRGETKAASAANATGWAWLDRGRLFLPTEREIWGQCVWSEQTYGAGLAQQLPLFAGSLRHVVKGLGEGGSRYSWWLSSSYAGSTSYPCNVGGGGLADYGNAYSEIGFALCFLLA